MVLKEKTDKVQTRRREDSRRDNMEVVLRAFDDDGVTSVITCSQFMNQRSSEEAEDVDCKG